MVLAKVGAPIMGELILTAVIVTVDFIADMIGRRVEAMASSSFSRKGN